MSVLLNNFLIAMLALVAAANANAVAGDTLESPEFLDRLEGHIDISGPIFVVRFSGPAGDVRVIGV